MFWKTKNFLSLQREWEKKLKDSGFEDIEEVIGGERRLRQAANNFSRSETSEQMEAKSLYYDLIRRGVELEQFTNPMHKLILTRVGDAMEHKQILRELKKKYWGYNRKYVPNIHTIYFIIRRYEHKWKIKKWTLQQLNLKQFPE